MYDKMEFVHIRSLCAWMALSFACCSFSEERRIVALRFFNVSDCKPEFSVAVSASQASSLLMSPVSSSPRRSVFMIYRRMYGSDVLPVIAGMRLMLA